MNLKFSKKKQVGTKHKSNPKITIKESDIQSLVDDLLEWKKIENIRIPDGVWASLKSKMPHVAIALAKGSHGNGLAGVADNTCFIKISDKYSLCLHLELKTEAGKLHGKQKTKAKHLPYQIARSTDEAVKIVEQFERDAEKIGKVINGNS